MPPASATNSIGRLPALDGLRAIAILAVVPHNLSFLASPTDAGSRFLVAALDRGWIGVQLFFVLSGFLITGILLDTRKSAGYFTSFYARRTLRIFPLYYVTLLTMFVVLPALGLLPVSVKRDAAVELSYWLYFSNWYEPFHQGLGSLPHLWSLALEEQFYLLWPLVVLRCSPASLLRTCVILAVAAPILRAAMLLLGASTEAVYTFLISRMDALALGGAAAAAFRVSWMADFIRRRHRAFLYSGLGLLLAGAGFSRGYYFSGVATLIAGYSILAAAFALVIASAVAAERIGAPDKWITPLRHPVLRSIATHSYAMYLLHVPLHLLVGKPLLARVGATGINSTVLDVAYVTLGTAATYVTAVVAYYLIEIHFLKMKDGLLARPAPQLRS